VPGKKRRVASRGKGLFKPADGAKKILSLSRNFSERRKAMKTNAILLALSLSFAGCALNYQDVKFLSDPPGATVKFAGQTCVTPCALTVLRGSAMKPEMVEFELSGHEQYYAEVVPGGIEYRNAWPHTLTATLPESGGREM
jgi:hypothetical protein